MNKYKIAQKHVVPLIVMMMFFGVTSCQPDFIETEKEEEPITEVPVEEEPGEQEDEDPPIEPEIDDWKPGTGGSIVFG